MPATKKKPYRYPGVDQAPPKVGKCGKCRVAILEAVVDGFSIRLDTNALSLDGQIVADESGRDLYELHPHKFGKGSEIFYRDDARILANRPHIGLASHECDAPLLEYVDPAGQARLDAWLFPAHPATEAFEPPF